MSDSLSAGSPNALAEASATVAALDADLASVRSDLSAAKAAADPAIQARTAARIAESHAQSNVRDAERSVSRLDDESTVGALVTFSLGRLRRERAAAHAELETAKAALEQAKAAHEAATQAAAEPAHAVSVLESTQHRLLGQRRAVIESAMAASGTPAAARVAAIDDSEHALDSIERDLDDLERDLDDLERDLKRAKREESVSSSYSSYSSMNVGGLNIGGLNIGGVSLAGVDGDVFNFGVSVGGLSIGGTSLGGLDFPGSSSTSYGSRPSDVDAPDLTTVEVDLSRTAKALRKLSDSMDAISRWSSPTRSQLNRALDHARDAIAAVERDQRAVTKVRESLAAERATLVSDFEASLLGVSASRPVRLSTRVAGRGIDPAGGRSA